MKFNIKKNRRFIEAVFTLTGTIIGAGILGLPYVFSQSGFFIGLFWLVVLTGILIYVNLCLGEVSLRTKETHQLTGYAEKYLGKKGKNWMLFSVIFGIYSALVAYLIGEGQSFSTLFTGNSNHEIWFALGFWVLMTALVYGGLKRLKQVESYGVLTIIAIILAIFFVMLPDVSVSNLRQINYSMFFFPFGVTLFALLGFMSIPELKRELANHERLLKRAVVIGIAVPAVIYAMFTLVFVGVLGKNVADVATISLTGVLGKILIVLGIFTMMTSYFVLNFSLKDTFIFDLKRIRKTSEFFFVSLLPLILYLIVTLFNFAGFVRVLGIGGTVSGGVAGILILLMNLKAKKHGNRKPEYSMRINNLVMWILSLIFVLGVVTEFIF